MQMGSRWWHQQGHDLRVLQVVHRYAAVWGATPGAIKLRPFFLGGVMAATGNQPPAMLPQRAVYLAKDMDRASAFFGVPMQQPDKFPSNTIKGPC